MKNSNHTSTVIASLLLATQIASAQVGNPPDPIILPGPASTAVATEHVKITLAQISTKPNNITDDAFWWKRLKLEKPEIYVRFPAGTRGTIPGSVPKSYQSEPLMAVWMASGRRFCAYGKDIYKTRYLLAEAPGGGKIDYAFDAKVYGTAAWAAIAGDTLYITNNPGNLAADQSGGAKLFAIDLKTNRLKWVSKKKTCRGQFLVIGGSIVCGYGSSGEPDFIYVLNRSTGKVTQTVKLKTAANWLIQKEGRLYVRCYNTDNIYRIKHEGRGR
jgi:hypothetical protein